MKVEAQVSVLKVVVFSPKYRKQLMTLIRDDVRNASKSGQGPSGAYAPYATPDLAGTPVDLTRTGAMLGSIRVGTRKKLGTLRSGTSYGRFVNEGTKKMVARPWLILRPRTLKRIQKWTKRRLTAAFGTSTLRRVV